MKQIIKLKVFHKLAVAVLLIIMVASVATSFAFWVNDIADVNKSKDLSINIGTGNTVTATLDLGNAPAINGDKVLIPYDLDEAYPFDQDTETKEIVFILPVTWLPDTEKAVQHTGKLEIELTKILSLSGFEDLKNEKGLRGNPLIDVRVEFSQDTEGSYTGGGSLSAGGIISHDIFTDGNTSTANPSIYAKVTVNLSEPKNQEQYTVIAGRVLGIELDFTVTAESIIND